jgi:hypothetical protein
MKNGVIGYDHQVEQCSENDPTLCSMVDKWEDDTIRCWNYEEMIIYMDGDGDYEFSL